MKKQTLKTILIIAGSLFVLALLAVFVLPLLISVPPLEGLVSAEEAATVDSKFITIPFSGTDGIDIHYLSDDIDSTEEGPVFVLMHGSNFNAYTWSAVIDYFGENGKVIAYDQPPYGLSEKLVDGDWEQENPYSSEAAITQLFALLDQFNVDHAILVGNSYGARLAVQAALAQPERIEALILADAAVYVNEQMPSWLLDSRQMRNIGPLFARMLGASEMFVQQTYLNPNLITPERMERTLVQTQITDWDTAYWEYLRIWGTETTDFVAQIPQIQQSVLVISGDSDAVVPVEDSQRLFSELPDAELSILPACGHVPQEECPDLFVEAVEEWLSELNQ